MVIARACILIEDPFVRSHAFVELAEREFAMEIVKPGDLVREKYRLSNDALGIELRSYIDAGKVLPVELIDRLIHEKLVRIAGKHVLIRNYPRSGEQWLLLLDSLHHCGLQLECIWHFKMVDLEAAMRLKWSENGYIDDEKLANSLSFGQRAIADNASISAIIARTMPIETVEFTAGMELSETMMRGMLGR